MLRQVVAEALEKNSMVTSVTVDPADDHIDDPEAKAWWVSVRRTNWLTRKRRWNFSVHLCAYLFSQEKGDGHGM